MIHLRPGLFSGGKLLGILGNVPSFSTANLAFRSSVLMDGGKPQGFTPPGWWQRLGVKGRLVKPVRFPKVLCFFLCFVSFAIFVGKMMENDLCEDMSGQKIWWFFGPNQLSGIWLREKMWKNVTWIYIVGGFFPKKVQTQWWRICVPCILMFAVLCLFNSPRSTWPLVQVKGPHIFVRGNHSVLPCFTPRIQCCQCWLSTSHGHHVLLSQSHARFGHV